MGRGSNGHRQYSLLVAVNISANHVIEFRIVVYRTDIKKRKFVVDTGTNFGPWKVKDEEKN